MADITTTRTIRIFRLAAEGEDGVWAVRSSRKGLRNMNRPVDPIIPYFFSPFFVYTHNVIYSLYICSNW